MPSNARRLKSPEELTLLLDEPVSVLCHNHPFETSDNTFRAERQAHRVAHDQRNARDAALQSVVLRYQ